MISHVVLPLHLFNFQFEFYILFYLTAFFPPQDMSYLSTLSFSGVPVKQEKPSAFPDSRILYPPRRTYIPEIHIPVRIPQRTVPVTSHPFVRQPHAEPSIPRQPFVPLRPSSPHQQPRQPVIMTGMAGPPGYAQRAHSRRERGSHELGKPINGFAGASGQRSHKLWISALLYVKRNKCLRPCLAPPPQAILL